ncbi:MAG: hypothetical protein LBV49_02410 [Azonexus sp.]|jgi:tetratricopeptide (TPR) repeat protein|nr:hypothetical protein [Azonexus sp.]
MSSFASSSPTPFWARIPRFFLFPFYPSVLWRLGLYAALPALLTYAAVASINIANPRSAFGWLGLAMLLGWLLHLHLCCRIFDETSQGRLSPDQYSDTKDESLKWVPYLMLMLIFIVGMAVGFITAGFGQGVGLAANFAANLMLPAALMVLVHTRSLFSGLSPAHIWELMTSIGKPYGLLVLFLFCLSTSQGFMAQWIVESKIIPLFVKFQEELKTMLELAADSEEPQAAFFAQAQALLIKYRLRLALIVFGINAAGMYFMTVALNMMGYVLYQYHEALGIAVDEPRRPGQRQQEADPVGQQVAGFLAAGQMDKALDAAYEGQRLAPDDAAAQERYHKLLHLAGRTDRLLPHANRLIPLLLRQQKAGRAFAALRRCRELAPDFRPEDPAVLLALAQAARQQREAKQALDLLSDFDKKYPKHSLIPDAWFLSAAILCEDLRQDEQADRLFAAIIERYADYPCAGQAKAYRQTLAQMKGQGQPPAAT